MPGVFYRAPQPGAPPFVEVGDVVTVGQTLCTLEAMKLFNELKAEVDGRVRAILVENGKRGGVRDASLRARSRRRPARRLGHPGMFSRVLVANRGEIAVRVIRAAHELGIEAVAVYSTADRDAMHVRLADDAVCIGPPAAAESYLRIPSVVAAAVTTGCQAVHPGYGFLAENPAFARACFENDLVFVGPSPDVMERLGDKGAAKREMRAAGIPLVPGTHEAGSLADLQEAAAAVGFPVLLKATAGGGGKGMRVVERADELADAFAAASNESEAAFGDGSLYLEKVVAPARHVEVQVLCDGAGSVLTLGERECSIQRRHQKLIEESPSPALDPDTREELEASVARACAAVGYLGAGTFEFLLGPEGEPYFIEVNCRLQVEHPVSELVTGIDVVREQLRIAAGERLALTGRAPRRGHAIEIRINAEDTTRGFAPAPGRRHDVPCAAGSRRPRGHGGGGRRRDPAVLRLADREADRARRGSALGAPPRCARARGAPRRGNPDDARARARGPALGRVRIGRLLDRLP